MSQPDWTKRDPKVMKVYRRKSLLKKRYGITPSQYESMLVAQHGVCALCLGTNKNGRNLAIDHNHITGEVRSLLCSHCNTGIGSLKENPVLMRLAAAYIERHST